MNWHISRQQHLRHAAILWVLVGTMLSVRGMLWLYADFGTRHWLLLILPCAMLLGVIKGQYVLRRTASRSVSRIRRLPDATPYWHLYSPATYLLIGGMMAFGVACRWAGMHWYIYGAVGTLYLVVGIALLTGSRVMFVRDAA